MAVPPIPPLVASLLTVGNEVAKGTPGVIAWTRMLPLMVTDPVARITRPLGTVRVPVTVRFVKLAPPAGGDVTQFSVPTVMLPAEPSP